jgi:hypothetical protein
MLPLRYILVVCRCRASLSGWGTESGSWWRVCACTYARVSSAPTTAPYKAQRCCSVCRMSLDHVIVVARRSYCLTVRCTSLHNHGVELERVTFANSTQRDNATCLVSFRRKARKATPDHLAFDSWPLFVMGVAVVGQKREMRFCVEREWAEAAVRRRRQWFDAASQERCALFVVCTC